MNSMVAKLAEKRTNLKREAEFRFWICFLSGCFLIVFFVPLATIFPSIVSSNIEMVIEFCLLLLSLWLLFHYSFQRGGSSYGGNSSNISSSSSYQPSAPSTYAAIPSVPPYTIIPSNPAPIQPPSNSPSTYKPSVGRPNGISPGAGGGSRRRSFGSSPQYDDGNFRAQSDYSWEEIQDTRLRNVGRTSAAGGLSSSSSPHTPQPNRTEWASISEAPTQYQPSPKDRVRGVRMTADGRAIPCTPALTYLNKEHMLSLWIETLRKGLGEYANSRLNEFDRTAANLAEVFMAMLTSGSAAAAPAPAIGGFPSFSIPGISPTATPPQSLTPDQRKNIAKVIHLMSGSVALDSEEALEVFSLLDKAKPDSSTNGIQLGKLQKSYRDALQLFTVLGEACPYASKAKNLPSVAKQVRYLCGNNPSSHDKTLKTGFSGRARGGKSDMNMGTVSEDLLVMGLFFVYCEEHSFSQTTYEFTRSHYFSSYALLLDTGDTGSPVGIVRNGSGEFDVYVRSSSGLLLLEFSNMSEGAVYSAMLVFLVLRFGLIQDQDTNRRARSLLAMVLDCELRDLQQVLRANFPSVL